MTFPTPRLVAVALAALLAACRPDAPLERTQVAARVAEGEITVHQVQAAMAREAASGGNADADAASRVLEGLIDQELAAQVARRHGLQEQPAHVQELELARRDLLARRLHEREDAELPAPTAEEVGRYYGEHPERFAQRRLYLLRETRIDAPRERVEPLIAAVEHAVDEAALAAVLRNAGLPMRSRDDARAAEDLPQALLAPLAALGEGRSLAQPYGEGLRVLTVLAARSAPVDRATAGPVIERLLVAQRQQARMAARVSEWRQATPIRYQSGMAPPAAAQVLP